MFELYLFYSTLAIILISIIGVLTYQIYKQKKMIDLMAEDFTKQLWSFGVIPNRRLKDGTEVIIDKEELIKIYSEITKVKVGDKVKLKKEHYGLERR